MAGERKSAKVHAFAPADFSSPREAMYPADDLPHLDLDDLLSRITPENVHPETLTGHAVGREFA